MRPGYVSPGSTRPARSAAWPGKPGAAEQAATVPRRPEHARLSQAQRHSAALWLGRGGGQRRGGTDGSDGSALRRRVAARPGKRATGEGQHPGGRLWLHPAHPAQPAVGSGARLQRRRIPARGMQRLAAEQPTAHPPGRRHGGYPRRRGGDDRRAHRGLVDPPATRGHRARRGHRTPRIISPAWRRSSASAPESSATPSAAPARSNWRGPIR